MNIHSLGILSQHYMQSLFGSGSGSSVSGSGGASNSTSAGNSTSGTSQGGSQSAFAQVLAGLQNLEQTSPTQYSQVTAQISTNLKNAAQTAKANGNGSLSSELTTLSNDFSSASSSGQLPNVQDLAKAMSGRHHGHGAPPASSSTASSVQANPATASLSSNIGLFQYLNSNSSLQQAAATSSQSLNPAGIIFSSLNNGTSAAAA